MTGTGRVEVPDAGAASGARLVGVDVARWLAILGMVTVHVGPYRDVPPGPAGDLWQLPWGRASVLFVVLAGLGVGLLERRSPTREVRARLVWRAVWLVPLGLWLQELDTPVAVILQYYGLYFLALVAYVGRRGRTLLVHAAGWAVLGAVVVTALRVRAPHLVAPLGGDPPLPVALVAGGFYPLVSWLGPMLAGLWLGRRDLARPDLWRRLVVVGATVAVGVHLGAVGLQRLLGVRPPAEQRSWAWMLSVEQHADVVPSVVAALGAAAAVLGACLWLADRAGRWLATAVAGGRLALTTYVGHLLVFQLAPGVLPVDSVAHGWRRLAQFVVLTSLLPWLWLQVRPRGPLEGLVRWPWRRVVLPVVRRVGARDAAPAEPGPGG